VLKLLAKQINNKDGECERILAAGIEAKVLLILNQEAGRCRELHAKKARYVAGIKVLFGSIPISLFAHLPVSVCVAPLRLCLRSHLDWQCYKINTLRGRWAVGGALSGNSCNSAKFGVAQWVDEWVCSRISVHCQQQLLRDLVAHQKPWFK